MPIAALADRSSEVGGPPLPPSARRGHVLHEQGVEKTTLADIARAADVPVGNVYYYFRPNGNST